MNYPSKKINPIANPFQSSQASNYSDSFVSNNDSPIKYKQKKFPNVFQYNDRQKIFISDSQNNSSSLLNNQSGENIFNFSTNKRNQQKVQDIGVGMKMKIKRLEEDRESKEQQFNSTKNTNQVMKQMNQMNDYERFSFNPNTNKYKTTLSKLIDQNNKCQTTKNTADNFKIKYMYQQKNQSPYIIKLTYDSPKITVFSLEDKQVKDKSDLVNQNNSKNNSNHNKDIQEPNNKKKTFKPSFLKQYQNSQSKATQQNNNNNKQVSIIGQTIKQDKQNKSDEQLLIINQLHLVSTIKQPQRKIYEQIHEQVQDENIQHLTIKVPIIMDKLKTKLLQEQKFNLGDISEVYSYTQNIFDNLKKQSQSENQQVDLSSPPKLIKEKPYSSDNDFNQKQNDNNKNKKSNNQPVKIQLPQKKEKEQHNFSKQKQDHSKKVVFNQKQQIKDLKRLIQSRLVQDDRRVPTSGSSKKPRRKIFGQKNFQSEYQKNNTTSQQQPHVSQFSHSVKISPFKSEHNPNQCLLKSLDIINKMTVQKFNLQNSHKIPRQQDRIVIVPPAPLTITQSPNKNTKILYPNPEQIRFRKQILQINFQIANFETMFELQQFDSRQQVQKVNWLNKASIRLFEQYKNFIIGSFLNNDQNSFLKIQILNIREASTKLMNFQQKYIQTKNVLTALQRELKEILLLNSKQKYKRLKLLNQAIQVMEKTQTYLSLQTGKIPVIIKSFIARQKLLLEEVRDWLKQCFHKQHVQVSSQKE